MHDEFLRTSEARAMLKLSRAGYDRLKRRPGFPAPIRFGPRALRWRRAELVAFAEACQRPKVA